VYMPAGDLPDVELVAVRGDSLVVAHRGLEQAIPLPSVWRLVEYSNLWGRVSGTTGGSIVGAVAGWFLNAVSVGSGWRSNGKEGIAIGLGVGVGGSIGYALGSLDVDRTVYDFTAMDVGERRDTITKLIAETGGR
jgi:hypothetical protein